MLNCWWPDASMIHLSTPEKEPQLSLYKALSSVLHCIYITIISVCVVPTIHCKDVWDMTCLHYHALLLYIYTTTCACMPEAGNGPCTIRVSSFRVGWCWCTHWDVAARPVTYDDSLGFKWSKIKCIGVMCYLLGFSDSRNQKNAGAETQWPIQNHPKPGSHKPEAYVPELEMMCRHLKSCMCDSRGSITCLLG